MPLPPMPEPPSLVRRAWAAVRIMPLVLFLGVTLILGNAAQTLSLVVMPLSRQAFRAINRSLAWWWWGMCVLASRHFNGARVVRTGDDVPELESALVVVNHQQMADIPVIMDLGWDKRRLGDLKWFVKDPLKWVPGVGWGMQFIDCIFVKRDWTKDQQRIEQTFSKIVDNRIPLWLITFVEGTRFTAKKREAARTWAQEHDHPPPEHVLMPRPRGFSAAALALRDHVDAVYDLTIGYVGGMPSLWQYAKGYAPVVHLHVRRYPTGELPESLDELRDWLFVRFREKDALLAHYYEHGAFPDSRDPV